MVVAALSPHNAWRQPILRLIDTAVGVAVGLAVAWLSTYVMRVTKLFGRDNSPKAHGEERA
jgi:multisubunit Na+/H+ antiporter MnhB subunit